MTIITFLSGCASGSASLTQYEKLSPELNVMEFFNGSVKAWGIVQDRQGRVLRRFEADLKGKWDGGDGILDEVFRYDDGEVQKRRWQLSLTGHHSFTGTAEDIIGTAQGEMRGNAMRLNYVMDIPVDGKNYRITFDDRMWLMMDEHTLVNRAYLTKFGIRVAELTVFMQKKNTARQKSRNSEE